MSAIIEYVVSLKDMLTEKLKNASHEAEHLEHTMMHASHTMADFGKELIGALGVGFAIFKGVEFVHEGVEAMHQLEQATAKVEANLESTGMKAGLAMTDIEGMAKELSSKIQFSRAEIMDMQSQILTFPNITKSTFGETMGMVADIAKQTNHGLSETAIMMGKAFNDPADGLKKLMRYGVMFSETEGEKIKKLQESGHLIEAQKAMLEMIASSGYKGVAEAMADADPLFRFNKIMGSIKMEVGELAMGLLKELKPALEWIATAFKNTLEWMKDHAELIKYIGIAVGVAAGVYGTYLVVTNAISIATRVWTGVQWLLNAAMSANPLGIIVIAIGAAVSAIIYCYKHFAKFRAVLFGVWETVKEFGRIVGDVFIGLQKMIHGVMTFNAGEIKEGWNQGANAMLQAGQRLGGAFKKGFDNGMADFAKDEAAEKAANAPKVVKKAIGAVTPPEATGKKETAKSTGNKSVNINIKIDNLVKDFSFNVKNIKEGANDVKAAIVQTMLSAVNDSQIIAGQ